MDLKHSWRLSRMFAVAALLAAAPAAMALIEFSRGNAPVPDQNWPAGSLELANLKDRVGLWVGPPFGGGQHHFLYAGDTAAFQRALDLFGKIQSDRLELFVHEGPIDDPILKDVRVDWTFTVWNPQQWQRLYGDKKNIFLADDPRFGQTMEAPRLDVAVGGGQIDWAKIKVPQNIHVTDERASAAGFKSSAIRGRVEDMLTSQPVADGQVVVEQREGQKQWKQVASGHSDASGKFVAENIPAGSYRIRASAHGYAPRLIEYAQFDKNTLREFAIKLAPSSAVAGTVADSDGKPLAGASVRVSSIVGPDGRGYSATDALETKTDENGHFVLRELPPGKALIFANLNGYQQLRVLTQQQIPDQKIAIRMTRTGGILGIVLTSEAKPVGGAYVNISPEGGDKPGTWGGGMNTAPDGTFHFTNVPPGKYILSTRPHAPDPDARKVQVTVGRTTSVQLIRR